MANIFRGKAQISGISGTVTVNAVAWTLLKESIKLTNNFELDVIKDETGNDAAWRASNEMDDGDIGLRLVDTGTPTSQANIETFSAALTPLVTIALSGFKPARFNGSYRLMTGTDYSLVNTTAGSAGLKLSKYVDSAQQVLSVTAFVPT